jgi:hypothetical protein
MSVLCEGVSVVVTRAAIRERFRGGMPAFAAIVPNRTYCAYEWLARVGFATERDARDFADTLCAHGLVFSETGEGSDIIIVYSRPCRCTPAGWAVLYAWTVEGRRVYTCGHRDAVLQPEKPFIAAPREWNPLVPEDYSPLRTITEVAGGLRELDLN